LLESAATSVNDHGIVAGEAVSAGASRNVLDISPSTAFHRIECHDGQTMGDGAQTAFGGIVSIWHPDGLDQKGNVSVQNLWRTDGGTGNGHAVPCVGEVVWVYCVDGSEILAARPRGTAQVRGCKIRGAIVAVPEGSEFPERRQAIDVSIGDVPHAFVVRTAVDARRVHDEGAGGVGEGYGSDASGGDGGGSQCGQLHETGVFDVLYVFGKGTDAEHSAPSRSNGGVARQLVLDAQEVMVDGAEPLFLELAGGVSGNDGSNDGGEDVVGDAEAGGERVSRQHDGGKNEGENGNKNGEEKENGEEQLLGPAIQRQAGRHCSCANKGKKRAACGTWYSENEVRRRNQAQAAAERGLDEIDLGHRGPKITAVGVAV